MLGQHRWAEHPGGVGKGDSMLFSVLDAESRKTNKQNTYIM